MPTAFDCIINTNGTPGVSGVDFSSLASWWAAMRGSSGTGTLALDSVGVITFPATISGAFSADTPVRQTGTNATGVFVYRNQSGQVLLKSVSNSGNGIKPNNTGTWYPTSDGSAGSNVLTPTSSFDSVIIKASCSGTTADMTPLVMDGIGGADIASHANRVEIQGNLGGIVWDESKYRIVASVSSDGVITKGGSTQLGIMLRSLQIQNTSSDVSSDLTSALRMRYVAMQSEGCIFRGGRNSIHLSTGLGRYTFRNSVSYGSSKAALMSGAPPVIAQNSTLIGGQYGFLVEAGSGYGSSENCYASGSVAAYSGNILKDRAASSDATGSEGYRNVPVSSATFLDTVTNDYRPRADGLLSGSGLDLSVGRTRIHGCTATTAATAAHGAPIGIICFTLGSPLVTFRLFETHSKQWYDGVQRSPNMTMTATMKHASTTGDWIVQVSDIHAPHGTFCKSVAFPTIDALNAGTVGGGLCTNKLKHLVAIGDLIDDDPGTRYGTGLNGYTDFFLNTSGQSGGPFGLSSIPWANCWHTTGNHDVHNVELGGSGGFEDYRFNRTNTVATRYTSPGGPVSDENKVVFEVGNNWFLLIPSPITLAGGSTGIIDNSWLRQVMADSVSNNANLHICSHGPRMGSIRSSYDNWGQDAQTVCRLAMTPSATFLSGHVHFGQYQGPDGGMALLEQDYPIRSSWDIGAGSVSYSLPRRSLRIRGKSIRGFRV